MAPLREDVVATFVGKGVDNLVRRSLPAAWRRPSRTPTPSPMPARSSTATTTR